MIENLCVDSSVQRLLYRVALLNFTSMAYSFFISFLLGDDALSIIFIALSLFVRLQRHLRQRGEPPQRSDSPIYKIGDRTQEVR